MLREAYLEEHERLRFERNREFELETGVLEAQIAKGPAGPTQFAELIRRLAPPAAQVVLRNARRHFVHSGTSSASPEHAYINVLIEHHKIVAAARAVRAALVRFPDDLLLRIKDALLLPAVYKNSRQLLHWRTRFSRRLDVLVTGLKLDGPAATQAAANAIHQWDNFELAYQARNDRDLQRRYGGLVHGILSAAHPELMASADVPPIPSNGKIRVGYISANLQRHSVAKSHAGWIPGRNSTAAEVFCYQIGGSESETRDEVRDASDNFRHLHGGFEACSKIIRADELHAAIFLDVGMDPVMALLASARLAPVQLVSWGHPVTTGSPSIDYYLSSELMEPADGDAQYTERLIRLPGIGVNYRKPLIPRPLVDSSRARFGLRGDSIVYLCCQSTFKYLPAHDDIFARIAKGLPNAQFVFLVGNPNWKPVFQERLDLAFGAVGLSARDYCVLLPRVGTVDFWGLNLTSNVYLDSLGWSGFNTTMEAIACGLPIVTLAGNSMRGRHGYAILTQLGIPETIANTKNEYVQIALRLGTDGQWRKEINQRTIEGHQRLYSDRRSVVALETFVADEVRLAVQRAATHGTSEMPHSQAPSRNS